MINLYLANLGKYNEGELVGAWLELPCTQEKIEETLIEIGVATMVDGAFKMGKIEKDENGYEYIYEEYAIHDWECDCDYIEIGEYSNLDDLNTLAEKFENIDEFEKKQLDAVLDGGFISKTDILEKEISKILDNYCVIELDDSLVMSNEEKLGYALVEEIYGNIKEVPNKDSYFDIHSFASDLKFDKDAIIEDMEEEEKEEFEDMDDVEFAEWYIDEIGGVQFLGEKTLESYFDYEKYGRDSIYSGTYVASNNMAIL